MAKKSEPKVINVFKDGSVRDTTEGIVVPITPRTLGAYRVIEQWIRDQLEREQKLSVEE